MNKILIRSALVALLLAGTALSEPIPPKARLSLELEGVPLTDVLQMIADQNHLNLVVSGDVQGKVTMRLNDVDIRSALDAILTAGGYTYFLKDDVIVVKPVGADVSSELVSKTMTLQYIDPVTAKKALDSRISDRGEVVVLDKAADGSSQSGPYRANRIVITERPNNIDQLVSLVKEMDAPERLVLIEAKIIETKIDDATKLGLQWPTSVSTDLTGADNGTSSSDYYTTTTSNNNSGVYDPNNGDWTWGKLSVGQASLILDMLDRNGNSKLISDPRITTLENHEAEIRIETVIPIQTINRFSEGAVIQDVVTFQDESVGISLKVTPRINGDGRITLEVNPTVEDIIGYSGPSDNQKPITASRSIVTQIAVNDGETVALGGLFKEDEIDVTHRVPLLGHIPLLGKILFSNSSKEKSTTDLIILITPSIVK